MAEMPQAKGKRECDMFNNGEAKVKAEVGAELEALGRRGYFLFALLKLSATRLLSQTTLFTGPFNTTIWEYGRDNATRTSIQRSKYVSCHFRTVFLIPSIPMGIQGSPCSHSLLRYPIPPTAPNMGQYNQRG